MNLFGFTVEVLFLVREGKTLAYTWHYSKDKAREHIPCHILVINKRTLMGFYPLGVEVKKAILKMEVVNWR